MQTLQDTAQFAAEQPQPDDTTLQSGFVMDISKGSLSMEATGLGACWGGTVCGCLCPVGMGLCKSCRKECLVLCVHACTVCTCLRMCQSGFTLAMQHDTMVQCCVAVLGHYPYCTFYHV